MSCMQNISNSSTIMNFNADNNLDKSIRKTSASYWSNVDKAKDLFRSYLKDHWLKEHSIDELPSIKVFDPSVGGGALLCAAFEVLRDDYNVTIDGSQLYGIEILTENYNQCLINLKERIGVTNAHILLGNSLDIDWREFLGEPPIVKQYNASDDWERFCK